MKLKKLLKGRGNIYMLRPCCRVILWLHLPSSGMGEPTTKKTSSNSLSLMKGTQKEKKETGEAIAASFDTSV